MPYSTYSITEKCLQQRALAMKAIERADAFTKSQAVSGLPSYLLKANQFEQSQFVTNKITLKDDSTVNASDLEKLVNENDKLSFNLREITARSSSLGNENQQKVDLISPQRNCDIDCDSEYSLKCGEIFGKIRKSDIQFQQLYNKPKNSDIETINVSDTYTNSWNPETQDSLILKLRNELFIPAELVVNKFETDEIEWHKNEDTIPKLTDVTQTNVSAFSGYLDDNTSTKNIEKISMSDFFKQKSDKISAFKFKSPEKKHFPIALIDITNSIIKNKIPHSNLHIEPKEPEESNSQLSDSDIPSVSKIEKALGEMGPHFTPTRFMDYLLNPKKYNYQDISPESYKISSENVTENYKKQQTLYETKKSARRSILTEISNNEGNIENKKLTEEKLLQNTNNFISNNKIKINNNLIVIDDSAENINPQSATLSSIKGSPVISCSELQLEEPDSSIEFINNSYTDWVKFEQSFDSYKTCFMLENDMWVDFIIQRDQCIFYAVDLVGVKFENQFFKNTDDVIIVRLPNKNELFKQENKQKFLICYMTLVIGHIELILKIKIKDLQTKTVKEVQHILYIDSEKADLHIKEKVINFDIIPEDCKKIQNISIYNNSKIDFHVNLKIVQEHKIFFIENNKINDCSKAELTNSVRILLRHSENNNVLISMNAPNLSANSHVKEFRGKVVMYLQNKTSSEVDLIGRVGYTKIQFRATCLPMILIPNKPKILNVKNAGVVEMDFKVCIFDRKIKIEDNNFNIVPNLISLKPSQSADLSITYNSSEKIIDSLYRLLRLSYEHGPSFSCTIEVTNDITKLSEPSKSSNLDIKSPSDIKTSPKTFHEIKERSPIISHSERNSPRDIGKTVSPISTTTSNQRSASTDSGAMCFPNGKLPIETSRYELVWDCVKPGKSQKQEFIIRNKSAQRVRFNITIDGTAFKIIKETEQLSSLRITLHERESRKLIISFTPIVIGAVSNKLVFSPTKPCTVANPKLQTIILYGYGGHSNIVINEVFKDLSGKIWLALGKRSNHENILEHTISLRNNGTLTAFYQFNLYLKPFLSNSITVSPKEAVISPAKEIEVIIKFTPKNEDLKLLRSSRTLDVFEVASLKLVTGAEVTRGRLRKIEARMPNSRLTSYSTDLLSKLTVAFPGECMPADLAICREQDTSASTKELFKGLTTREIILTMEENTDETMGLSHIDDSYFFHTLCHETQLSFTDDTRLDKSNERTSTEFGIVEPTTIVLMPPQKTMDTILLHSKHSGPAPFEIKTTLSQLLVDPQVGLVPPRETTMLSVMFNPEKPFHRQPLTGDIVVYFKNQEIIVKVQVIHVQPITNRKT